MKWWYALSLPGLMPVLAVLPVPSAAAADSRCSTLAFAADPAVRSRWPDVIEGLRETFDARQDIDTCARVRLSTRDGSIAVQVRLPDGRFAVRSVARRDDVVPTLEALLLLPQAKLPAATLQPLPAQAPVPSAPVDAPTRAASVSRTPSPVRVADRPVADHGAAAEEHGVDANGGLRIEFSVTTGARIGDGQVSVGLGALSFLDIAGWLVGFEGRADQYQSLTASSSASALELALLSGRRFRFRSMALDLTAGPALAMLDGGSVSRVGPAPGVGMLPELSGEEGITPRLLVGARLNFGARSVFRSFVGMDGAFALRRTTAAELALHGVEAALPAWTVGLALGASVGTL